MGAGESEVETSQEWQARSAAARARATNYSEMHEQLTRMRCTATSADDAVRVTIDSAGALTELEIAEGGDVPSGPRLAECIMTAIRSAQSDIPGRVEQVLSGLASTDGKAAEAVLTGFRERYAPADRETDVPTPQAILEPTDDEYFSRSPLDDF